MGSLSARANRRMAVAACWLLVASVGLSILLLSLPGASPGAGASPGDGIAQAAKARWFEIKITHLEPAGSMSDTPASFLDRLGSMMQYSPITVYKDGLAEASYSSGAITYEFKGRYDKSAGKLTGSVDSRDRMAILDERFQWDQTFKGELTLASRNRDEMKGTLSGVQETWRTRVDSGETDMRETTNPDCVVRATAGDGFERTGPGDGDGETEADEDLDEDLADEETTPEETDGDGGGGSKIPGPGSWVQWFIGTVVAGLAAAGLGLAGMAFGAPPPPPAAPVTEPPTSLWTPPEPPGPGVAGGTADPFSRDVDPYQQAPENLMTQTFANIADDLATVPGYLKDKGKWALDGVTDVNNWKEAMEKAGELHEWHKDFQKETFRKAVGYIQETTRNPMKPAQDLEDAREALGKYLAEEVLIPVLQDPWAALKSILGAGLWENAVDYNRPLPERFLYSGLATLNAIGLLEGASGLKNWLFGGGGKGAGRALAGSRAKDKLDDAAGAARKVVKVKGTTGYFDDLSGADKGRLRTMWNTQTQKARSKVKNFKKAMKSGDRKKQLDAVLAVDSDPLAIQDLNAKDRATVRGFKRQLQDVQDDAMKNTLKEIAGDTPVKTEVFKGKNPLKPGTRIKAGMDQDMTVRVTTRDGRTVDIPADKLQKTYDENFYKAMGSPEGTTPAQLGRDCRNVAVDRHSAEAWGMSPEDFDAVMRGKAASHPETVVQTMRYKPEEAFARADKLAREALAQQDKLARTRGLEKAMAERWLGQRETVKAFNNQVKTRVEYLRRQASPGKMAAINKKIAGVEGAIEEVEKMMGRGATPVQIDDFLKSRGTSSEDLAKKVAEIYGGL